MRLNFWQWLGVALLVIGGSVWIYNHTSQHTADPATQPLHPATTPNKPG